MEQNKKGNGIYVALAIIAIVAAFLVYAIVNRAPITDDGTGVITPPPKPAPLITGDTANLVSFSIAPGQQVSGTMTATGTLTGAYFFEANIRVNILDANKVALKQSYGTATTDWMTSGPISFTTNLDFTGIPAGNGFVRLMNDNPSGDPANDKYIDIPVVFQ